MPSEATLEASIEQFTGYVREETGLTVVLDIDPVSDSVSPEARLLMFTVVQALIFRELGGAQTSNLTVRLRSHDAWTVLELEMVRLKPAVPVLPAEYPPDTGWSVIRERARAFGGEFDITADSGRARARISFPVSSEA